MDLEPYRRELLVHCYRMLGSVHDAEDLVQETMLRAWRAADQYDPARASLRTWLYRIATNACLTALKQGGHRPLPSGLVAMGEDPTAPLRPGGEVTWLQPLPDTMLGGDPAAVVGLRGSLRLALIAAMQLLPARQRAILILREVLGLSAAEVADALETTTAAVNSGLQRARARLEGAALEEEQLADAGDREVLDRYVAAFENADVPALKRLLADDAILEMPPFLNWYSGADAYAAFMGRVYGLRGTDWRLVPAPSANGQPAFAAYVRAEDGVMRLHTLQVFAVSKGRVEHNVVFMDQAVFDLFGLAPTLEA
ncbi:MAG: sigma-70 family RNA polymerase sigma factor [Nonomuraea sp.]|nr:sigma-70 family RNA polymerase sigma factor [Nonomuraea sp.]